MDDGTVASWVLLSVGSISQTEEVALGDVIATADAINHAVLLHSEMELAVQILEGVGLVAARGSALRLSESGRAELQRAESRSWHAMWTQLRNRLERLGVSERSPWQVPSAEFDAAVETYLRRARGWTRKP